MQSSSLGFQVQFTVTIPAIDPLALQFDPNPKTGLDRTILGRGGFGVVYAGRYQGQPVAIKTLHVTTAKVVKSLYEEAAVMFRIASPYTVKLQGICSDGNEASLVMERMLGDSLFHLLQDDTKELPWSLRYRIAYEVAEGLWSLHSQEILHRDLKSLNVLLDEEHHAKITDFGFSKLRGQVTSIAASSGQPAGTLAYKAPELIKHDVQLMLQAMQGFDDGADDKDDDDNKAKIALRKEKQSAPYTPYSDIYSYGVILWELASRSVAFNGKSEAEIKAEIMRGKTEKIPADCPLEFAELIKACWAMKPGQRPRTDKLVAQMKVLYETVEAARVAALAAGQKSVGHEQNQKNEEKADYIPASWHMDPATKATAGVVENYKLLDVSQVDRDKVEASYWQSPVPGYSIKRIEVVYNPSLNREFAINLSLLEKRHGKPAFEPKWQKEQGPSGAWRKSTHQILEALAAPHKDPSYPHVTLVPMWHTTKQEVLPSLFEVGFASLAETDPGFFGKGIYSAGEAQYSYTVYGTLNAKTPNPALLMNWVSAYSAYPVIDGDMVQLAAGPNFGNYDAHFVPVLPQDPNNPNETVFYPCKLNKPYKYTELVVFKSSQCLPRYLVTLQKDDPNKSLGIDVEEIQIKQQAGQAQKAEAKQAEEIEKQLTAQEAAKEAQVEEQKITPKQAALEQPLLEIALQEIGGHPAQSVVDLEQARKCAEQNLLRFGKELGMGELKFDKNNTCILGIDNKFSLHLTFEPNTKRLYLYSPLLDGLPVDRSVRLGLYEKFLEANLLGGQTGSGGIGIAPKKGLVLYHTTLDMQALQVDMLQEIAKNYVPAVEKLRDFCKRYIAGEPVNIVKIEPLYVLPNQVSSRLNAEHNLTNFGNELNLKGLEFDESNTRILGIDNEFSLHLTYEPNSQDLYLYSPLLDGLPEDKNLRLALYERLLEGAMLGGQMIGGGVGLAVKEELVLIHIKLNMATSTAMALKEIAPFYVETVEKWRKICAEIYKKQKASSSSWKLTSLIPFWKPAAKTPSQVARFLRLVAEGEQDQAEAMLKVDSNLALQSGTVTDLSKRIFKRITGFQYAVWAKDWHMWTMLLKYLPKEEAALQFHALETNGTEYGTQFDFGALIAAYQALDQNWNNWDYKKRNTHWVKQVGGAQLLLPVHVVNEYCRPDRSFYPLPDFTTEGLARIRSDDSGTDWFKGDCAKKWAFVRGATPNPCRGMVGPKTSGKDLFIDASAIQSLVVSREQQLQMLKAALYIPELIDNKVAQKEQTAQQPLQSEKAEKESAKQAQIEADLKLAQKLQAEETEKEEQLKIKAKAEQVAKMKAEEAEKRHAAEERKDDEDKTEGRVKVYSPIWQPAYGKFWKPKVQTPPQVAQFLRLVAEGEQTQAEAMLKANPNLTLQSGTMTDLSKRTFEHITAFQYAVWARDWHMWTMLLKYLPEEEAVLQLHALETNGTEHGTHFDFGTLIGAYQTLEQNYKAWGYFECEAHWVQQIGGAQLLLPVHAVNEYCRRDRPLCPLPDFTTLNLPRERSNDSGKDWYAEDCGMNWSFYRAYARRAEKLDYGKIMTGMYIKHDRHAMQSLMKTRAQQLQMLKTSLYQNRQELGAKVA